jgi:hypothetical protein
MSKQIHPALFPIEKSLNPPILMLARAQPHSHVLPTVSLAQILMALLRCPEGLPLETSIPPTPSGGRSPRRSLECPPPGPAL